MSITQTSRLLLDKPDNAEFVSIALLDSNFDAIDKNFLPAAKLVQTIDQTVVTTTVTNMTFDTLEYDSYADRGSPMANLSSDDITIRKAGLYLCLAKVAFQATGAGTRRINIMKNGASFVGKQLHPSAAFTTSVEAFAIMSLAVNDVIAVHVLQTSGVNLITVDNGFPDNRSLAVVWFGDLV